MQNVDLWINKKISTMLQIAGYSVKTDCFEKDRKFIINGQILKVCTIGYFGYEGKVIINVNVSSDSTIIINRSYTGLKRIGDPSCIYTSKLFEKTLKAALDSAISQMINDINKLDSSTNKSFLNTTNFTSSGSPFKQGIHSESKSDIDTINCVQKKNQPVIISGNRPIANIKSGFSDIRMKLHSMYKSRLKLNGSLAGDICVSFEITPDNKVNNIKVISNTQMDKPIEDELINLLSNKCFDGMLFKVDTTTVLYNYSFQREPGKTRRSVGIFIGTMVTIALAILPITILNNNNKL